MKLLLMVLLVQLFCLIAMPVNWLWYKYKTEWVWYMRER